MMAANADIQYRPCSQYETGVLDPLSVRWIHETAHAINNMRERVLCSKLAHFHDPNPVAISPTDAGRSLGWLGLHHIPRGCRYIRWWLRAWRTSGSGELTFTLHSALNRYAEPRGTTYFDSSLLAGESSDSIIIDNGNPEIMTSRMSVNFRNYYNNIYLYYSWVSSDGTSEFKISFLESQIEYG